VETEDQLRNLLQHSMRGVDPVVPELVAGALREGRASRRSRLVGWGAGLAAAAAAAVVVTTVALTSPWEDHRATGPAGGPTDPAAPCHAEVTVGVLPSWARRGFSDPRPVMPYTLGDNGRIIAILWGNPLHAPPSNEVNNKILWVARTAGTTLSIDAVRAGDGKVAHREVPGGPGPSTIDLPGAGCWQLTLSWGNDPALRDTMDLEYVRP
jgi:hypothetical protein